eukprot:6331932-Amphidinium_carterae.1
MQYYYDSQLIKVWPVLGSMFVTEDAQTQSTKTKNFTQMNRTRRICPKNKLKLSTKLKGKSHKG